MEEEKRTDKRSKGSREVLIPFRGQDDLTKLLWAQRAVKVARETISKLKLEIGMLTSERDEYLYELKPLRQFKADHLNAVKDLKKRRRDLAHEVRELKKEVKYYKLKFDECSKTMTRNTV
jgi:uncharacterized coiled-coil DUF342 family protein